MNIKDFEVHFRKKLEEWTQLSELPDDHYTPFDDTSIS